MDIQSIHAFLKVSELGSFSRAAEVLFITQPAVSKRIQALEYSLNTKLFDRIGKSVQLTEAGSALIPGYKRILGEIDESQRIISNLRRTTSGNLCFATSHHIGLHRLPPVLRSYSRNYPDVKLDIKFTGSEQALPLIQNGDIELAIITLPEIKQTHLTTIPLWNDPMFCLVANDHQLAKHKKISNEELLKHPAILQTTGSQTRTLIDESIGLATQVIFETDYLETIKAMVEIGLGWSILPHSMSNKKLHALNIKGVNIERKLGVIYHPTRTLSSAANAMLDLLKKHSD